MTFLVFNSQAAASGIESTSPALAQQLQLASARMSELARNSAQESEQEDDDLEKALSARSVESMISEQAEGQIPATNSGSTWGYQTFYEVGDADGEIDGENTQRTSTSQVQPVRPHVPLWTGAEIMQQHQNEPPGSLDSDDNLLAAGYAIPGHTPEVLETPSVQDFQESNDAERDQHVQDLDQTSLIYPARPLDGPLQKHVESLISGKPLIDLATLPAPRHYSFLEATFARRLARTALDSAYRIMTNPGSSPEDIRRICRLTWCFTSSSKIIEHMKVLMDGKSMEKLSACEIPAMHIGGAGLHFPRPGINKRSRNMQQAIIGPYRPSIPETPVPNDTTIDQMIERIGFDGEWFDPNDVEQYLRSKGLYLDGRSSIVELNDVEELEPSLEEAQPSLVSTSGVPSSPRSTGELGSPNGTHPAWQTNPFLQGTDYMLSEDPYALPSTPDMNMNLSASDTGDALADFNLKAISSDLDFSNIDFEMPNINTKAKKFVDVDKFLDSEFSTFDFTSLS